MAIIPKAGYKVDPNNPNGVVPIDYIAPPSTTPTNTPISVSGLQTPQTPLNVQTPAPTLPYNVAGLSSDLQPTAQELEISAGNKYQGELYKKLLGESTYRAEKENEAGLPEQLKAQQDLSSRLKALQNEALAIPIQLQTDSEGRGRTAGGLRPIETGALRDNAIQALGVSSLLEASRGNITLAQDLVDRAVAQKFDPIKEEIAVNKANLDLILNDPLTTLADKNRATRQKEIQDAKASAIARQEADAKDIRNLALTAQKYNAPMDVVQKIQNAESFNEAQLLASTYLVDPKAKYELEAARLDNVLKQSEITYKQKQTQLLGEPTATERKEITKALQEAQSALPAMQDKITAVDVLAKHPGMSSRVGANILSRSPQGFFGTLGRIATGVGIPTLIDPALDAVTGAGQEFSGGVHKLTSGLNLQELIEAKSRGATFGALSNQELRVLASAASAISDWEIKKRKDGEDIGTGFWDIDEASFKRELDTVKTLTQRAIERSGGKILTDEDQAIIDALYDVEQFNPAF